MNKFEKQVFNSLSEEEQEKIAGGENIHPDKDLTKEQCSRFRQSINLNRQMLLQIGYGAHIPYRPVNWPLPTKPTKPLQPLDPVTPKEKQQNTTSYPNTTHTS